MWCNTRSKPPRCLKLLSGLELFQELLRSQRRQEPRRKVGRLWEPKLQKPSRRRSLPRGGLREEGTTRWGLKVGEEATHTWAVLVALFTKIKVTTRSEKRWKMIPDPLFFVEINRLQRIRAALKPCPHIFKNKQTTNGYLLPMT